jgi:hypothetical protein
MPRPRATRTVQEYDTDGSGSGCTPPSSDEQIHKTATARRNAKAVDILELRQLMHKRRSAKASDMAARKEAADRAGELQMFGDAAGKAPDSRALSCSELGHTLAQADGRLGEIFDRVLDFGHDADVPRLRDNYKVQMHQIYTLF